jgi:hypothetical protein
MARNTDMAEGNIHLKITTGEAVNHPAHYGGADNPYEAIKVIEAWDLDFSLGNAVKYIARAGKKAGVSDIEDLTKAAWYLNREIERRTEERYQRARRTMESSDLGNSTRDVRRSQSEDAV